MRISTTSDAMNCINIGSNDSSLELKWMDLTVTDLPTARREAGCGRMTTC